MWELSPGPLGEKRKRYLCAMWPPLTANLPTNVLFNRQHQLCKILHQCFSDYSQQKLGSNSSRSFSNEMLSFYFFICLISERFYCVARFTVCSFFHIKKWLGADLRNFDLFGFHRFHPTPKMQKSGLFRFFRNKKSVKNRLRNRNRWKWWIWEAPENELNRLRF